MLHDQKNQSVVVIVVIWCMNNLLIAANMSNIGEIYNQITKRFQMHNLY